MPVAVLAQPMGVSTPLAPSARPLLLLVNGNDYTPVVAIETIKLRDQGFSAPAILSFTAKERGNTYGAKLAKRQPVQLLADAQTSSNGVENYTALFTGFIEKLKATPQAAFAVWEVDAVDLSIQLDRSRPITGYDAGERGTDQTAILQLLGYYGYSLMGAGGQVQSQATLPASVPIAGTTLRGAIEQVIAAGGVSGATYYLDPLNIFHSLTLGDVTAPYNLSDAPNYTTTIPAALTREQDASPDVDVVYVRGSTPAGSGAVLSARAVPYGLTYEAMVDHQESMSAATLANAAAAEFGGRQSVETLTAVVTGYDGWAKGQSITVTNSVLGLSGATYIITAVSMDVLNGQGLRRYTLTLGDDPVSFKTHLRAAHAASHKKATAGTKVQGSVGGTLP